MPDSDKTKSGTIYPWFISIDEIPKGYNLCDGSNGTPDLRGYKPPEDKSPRPHEQPPNYIMKT